MSNTVDFLFKGVLIGLSIAAPVGPIGVLTIKRTLSEGRLAGLATGMGAAFADATYGCVAAFGLTAISGFFLDQATFIRLLGGMFLLYLGIRGILSKPVQKEVNVKSSGHFNHLISTFFLTLTNPTTILSFLAVFAGLGLAAEAGDYAASSFLVAGVFLGSAVWWLFLSWLVNSFRTAITPKGMLWIGRLSGLILLAFGIWVVYPVMMQVLG